MMLQRTFVLKKKVDHIVRELYKYKVEKNYHVRERREIRHSFDRSRSAKTKEHRDFDSEIDFGNK